MASHITYGAYAREALLAVVRRVLCEASCGGIPAPHHFYISFRTDHAQTEVPAFLKESYPDQMTIILQHQFWDLHVEEEGFSVVLSFSGARESLSIPFDALTGFSDPSVKFSLQFLPDFSMPGAPPLLPTGSDDSPSFPAQKSQSHKGDKGQVVHLESFRKKE
ncbi:MAG: ClpXP protease specificity-enhancing factor SspB [Holosporales bacterium]|jgi:hypothetical protein|nr:ClpXP protease specificity-enhancing factor SspB [Holosporales bacterium]